MLLVQQAGYTQADIGWKVTTEGKNIGVGITPREFKTRIKIHGN